MVIAQYNILQIEKLVEYAPKLCQCRNKIAHFGHRFHEEEKQITV